jgi:hypothetical protein
MKRRSRRRHEMTASERRASIFSPETYSWLSQL